MNASYEWLKAFIDIEADPYRLRDLLTSHTATVEDVVPLRSDLAPIVVARVVEAGPHPDSDHLWLTRVDAGGELLEVVCGAPNVVQGALYPFAPVGTTMPNGMKIERRKIRGIYSNGMLCSARELGLGDDHQGILQLHIDARPGTRFLEVMPAGDSRLVIDVGANRPDLLSHLGLAREIGVVTGRPWQLPEIPGMVPPIPKPTTVSGNGSTGGIDVRVDLDTRTRRYMAAVIRGVTVQPGPEWLARRLEAVGVRPISNVVDATNYVLHELGQPVHAFDSTRLGKRVHVRKAHAKESLRTLDNVTRTLNADVVVIADGERAQAVAGVMGGGDSEVSAATTDLFVEVASFDPRLTRAARRGLGLSTDASYRFERGVDVNLAPLALDRVVRLIMAVAGGTVADAPLDVLAEPASPLELVLRLKRITQVLGAEVPLDRARKYLEGAGFETVSKSDRELTVRVPSWRGDVSSEIDLVEEVARFHGYDTFPDDIRPFRPTTTRDDPHWTLANRLRERLVGMGLHEVRPMPFVSGSDETHVRVANPLAENEAHLRTSLLETLSRRAEFNLSHRTGDVRLFELGSVFTRGTSAMPREEFRLGAVIMGRRRPAHFTEPDPPAYDEWDAKAIAEAVLPVVRTDGAATLAGAEGGLWNISAGGEIIGTVRRLNLDAPVWAAPAYGIEISLGDVATTPVAVQGSHDYVRQASATAVVQQPRYSALPTMPAAEFDLALLVPARTPAAEVERVIRESSGDLLEQLTLFDQYVGPGIPDGLRSLAWRLTFRHPERTLRDKEIEGRRGKILGALQQELNVRQRTG
ncbi:MAG TPA: phenylalanine--tRNA ligase subunit beta [Gemmatimonadaceae bacterium]|nr:phenylalanine--tRNA ligase subunit beta [Gemmatimonadaceae bacterium]